jgi:hypothetical protein
VPDGLFEGQEASCTRPSGSLVRSESGQTNRRRGRTLDFRMAAGCRGDASGVTNGTASRRGLPREIFGGTHNADQLLMKTGIGAGNDRVGPEGPRESLEAVGQGPWPGFPPERILSRVYGPTQPSVRARVRARGLEPAGAMVHAGSGTNTRGLSSPWFATPRLAVVTAASLGAPGHVTTPTRSPTTKARFYVSPWAMALGPLGDRFDVS